MNEEGIARVVPQHHMEEEKKIACGLLTLTTKLYTHYHIDALQLCVDMDLCFI